MRVVVCFLLPIVQRESRATIQSVLGGKAGGNVVVVVACKADGAVVLLECWGRLRERLSEDVVNEVEGERRRRRRVDDALAVEAAGEW